MAELANHYSTVCKRGGGWPSTKAANKSPKQTKGDRNIDQNSNNEPIRVSLSD